MHAAEESIRPPEDAGLAWRALDSGDVAALCALETAGRMADGGRPEVGTEELTRERYAPGAGGTASIGAFRGDGLAAATAVQLQANGDGGRAEIAGMTHPEARGRGLGDFLMRWSLARARALLAACPPGERTIRVTTDSRTPAADALYARHGLRETHASYMMRRDLDRPLPAAPLPPGIEQASWTADTAPLFYEAYHAAFRERPGFPGLTAEEWIADVVRGNDDLNPARTRVVLDAGRPAAFLINAINWVVQIGVRPEWRGRGIAQALIVQLMRELQGDGERECWLQVHENNPRAIRAYEKLGFVVGGRRARYEIKE